MKMTEEDDRTPRRNDRAESLGDFTRRLRSFCGLEDIDIIAQRQSMVWQSGHPPALPITTGDHAGG